MKNLYCILLLNIMFTGISLHSQVPVLVKDINPNGNSSPQSLCVYNNKVYFGASNGISSGLYVSDGTDPGTLLIKDSISVSNLFVFNNFLYFRTTSPQKELWRSDGTTQGTFMVKSGFNSLVIPATPVWGNMFFFYADYGTYGNELWVSDGTPSGTLMLKDIGTGSDDGIPIAYSDFAEFNGKLYFTAETATNGREVWYTDGTTAGTQMLKDIYLGSGSGADGYPTFKVYNNMLYFAANDGFNGMEIWRTDGTAAGTQMFMDINFGSASSINMRVHFYNFTSGITQLLLFYANDGVHGSELWRTNGTVGGTYMIKDINPGSAFSSHTYEFEGIYYFFNFYFRAWNGVNGYELWRTNGTEAGTYMVKDIYTGSNHATPQKFITYHQRIYFTANDSVGGSVGGGNLYRTNGTDTGTVKVVPLIMTTTSSTPDWMTVKNGETMFYAAEYNLLGRELWKLDLLYYVMVSADPPAGGIVTGGGGFHQGDTVTVTAVPNPNYNFVNWTEGGVVVSTLSTYTFNMSIFDRNLVANFQVITDREETTAQLAEIFPNPAENELWVLLPEDCSEPYHWQIFNIDGQLKVAGGKLSIGINKLDISDLSSGVYYVVLRNKTDQLYKKIIVMDQ